MPTRPRDQQITIKVPGTGAVARVLDVKLSDLVSAKDFGAVSDGITDDSVAVQAAITAAGTTGNVMIPPNTICTYTNPNNIVIFDYHIPGNLKITGYVTFRTASNIRYASEFATGSNTGGIAEAYADGPATGVIIIMDKDITISSAQTLTLVSGKDFILEMASRNLTFTHSSGVGLTVSGSLIRQIFEIKNGSFIGNSNTGITGLKLSAVLGGSIRDSVFTNFLGTNQIATVLDNTQDSTLDNVQWLNNNNTGTIALDLSNTSNANAYHSCQFQNNTTAVRIRGATSGSWFSDCLIQSQVATNAVVVQATGSDGNITDTHFERCWFENNGDSTANASSVYFNTDAGKVIQGTSFLNNHFNGNNTGNLGVAFRFSSTGSPGRYFHSGGNTFQSGSYATVQGGWDTTVTQIFSAVADADGTGTERFMVGMNSGNDIGLLFKPPGAAATWQMYGGYVNNDDGYFKIFRAGSYIGGFNANSYLTWGGTTTAPNFRVSGGGSVTAGRTVLTYSASIATDVSLGNSFSITATNGTAFTISNPSNTITGQRVLYTIRNTSGGALGAVTWGSNFLLTNWRSPPNGYSRSIEFIWDGSNFVQVGGLALLVPNSGAATNIGDVIEVGSTVALTGQTANLAATNIVTAAEVGEYRVSATARTTTSGTGTTATLNIIWTDEGGVKTHLVGTWALNSVTVTGQINVSEVIHAAAATNIQVSVTAGTYGTSVYALSATAERLN